MYCLATLIFDTLSIDLMYGIPDWPWNQGGISNIDKALILEFPIFSIIPYRGSLNTALKIIYRQRLNPTRRWSKWQKLTSIIFWSQELERRPFGKLWDFLNFENRIFSLRITPPYWQGKKYFGHWSPHNSYEVFVDGWNNNNATTYINTCSENQLHGNRGFVRSNRDRYNEYI